MSEEVHAFQITVYASENAAPWQESYHKYYLKRTGLPDEERAAQEVNLICFATAVFRDDFCIRNKLKSEEVMTRVEKVIFSSDRRDFN